MPNPITISAPATITVLAGNPDLSSLTSLPPGWISLSGAGLTGTVAVTLVAANASTLLTASAASGGTVSSSGNTVAISGSLAQVNAALTSLKITEASGGTTDTVMVSATASGGLTGSTAIAIQSWPDTGPAFANPPATFDLPPYVLSPLSGLVIGDPAASALTAMGQGRDETMALTLAASSGALFLPGLSSADGIMAQGIGTGTVLLTFTADQLAAVNTLLADLTFIAPAGSTGIAYALRNVSGPLGGTVTSGNISLDITGTPGPDGVFTVGGHTLIVGPESFAAGTSLVITSDTSDLGGITGEGALWIAPDAALDLPYNGLSLSGTSLDFGGLTATTFGEAGSIFIAEGASFSGPVLLGTLSAILFNGMLTANGDAANANDLAVSLGTGAVIDGNGTLLAGNFSEAGLITGEGTLLAGAGATLVLAADSIGGSALLEVAAGGVMVLGPVDPLYGVFDATALTIDPTVTLAFTGLPGAATIAGGYADTLGQSGGVFVINGPQVFSGTITGFVPGDRLIFPGLSDISLYNVTDQGFDIAGLDGDGNTQTYAIAADYPAGTNPYVGVDVEGDAEISLRGNDAAVFLNGVSAVAAGLTVAPGILQPIQGLQILPYLQSSLSLTLSVEHGILSDPGFASGKNIVFTAANAAALNERLSGLGYTGATADILTITAGSGALVGLDIELTIATASPATLASFIAATAADTVTFAAAALTPMAAAAAPGQIIVTGLADFADILAVGGLAGKAIIVDGEGTAIFDAAAIVVTAGDVIIGDASGPGTLAVLTDAFSIAGGHDLILSGDTGASGSLADITGSVAVSGNLVVGASAAAALYLSGGLSALGVEIGTAGTLTAAENAAASFGTVIDDGTIFLTEAAFVSADNMTLAGLLGLGGTATMSVQNAISLETGGILQIGPAAVLNAADFTETGGRIDDAGILSAGDFTAAGLINLAAGTIIGSALTLGAMATLTGYGVVDEGSITNQGTMTASGGSLNLGGAVSNSGIIEIGASASLGIVSGITGGNIEFIGADALLTVNNLGAFSAAVGGMVGHDAIDLVGISPNAVTFTNGSISTSSGGFGLGIQAGQPAVQILADGHGGALITLGGEMPCFARGTRLLTPAGYRPIEEMSPGDPLITANGDRRPIRWIGRRTIDLADTKTARPVVFLPDSFGPGCPMRPVYLSPLHAVHAGGVLVPAMHLVNGATIIEDENRAAATYFHIELDRHDIVLADGLPCETYFDTGNRGALYTERGIRSPASHEYARRVTAGVKLAAIRGLLHERALAAGFSLTYQPVLRTVSAGGSAVPEITTRRGQRIARFSLPVPTRHLTLLSRAARPAETDPDSEDRRPLSLCLSRAQAGKKRGCLGAGWYPEAAADQGRWMAGKSELSFVEPVHSLMLSLVAIIQTWRPPGVDRTGLPP